MAEGYSQGSTSASKSTLTTENKPTDAVDYLCDTPPSYCSLWQSLKNILYQLC